ncbi:MAG: hypothetical protein GC136_03230 [Alphaproteobacteria bacterium]|nr:hypothetical protein [Alphaproteobacteria bacterium]
MGIKNIPAGRHNEAGIALIIAAVALLAVSSFVVFGTGFIKGKDRDDSNLMTRQKMERIMTQAAAFAQMYNRLPCAADPKDDRFDIDFGAEDRDGAGEVCDSYDGIVPFRAFGIQERDVKDAYGRYITYHVSPVFTDLDRYEDEGVDVGDRCRYSEDEIWIGDMPLDGNAGPNADVRNLNPAKAKFCCPDISVHAPGTDISVTKQGAALVIRVGTADITARSNGNVGGIDAGINYVDVNEDVNHEAVAVMLVSHGYNGVGAYLGGNAQVAGDGGNDEDANSDGDAAFIDKSFIYASGNAYFDDILLYKTQNQLYAMLGGTCVKPFR